MISIFKKRFLETVLKRAQKFHLALYNGSALEEQKNVKYILLGSDCQPTLARVIVEQKGKDFDTVFKAKNPIYKDLLYSFGDGSVTKESLLGLNNVKDGLKRLPSAYEVFVCEAHQDLAVSPTYLDNILHAIMEDSYLLENCFIYEGAKKDENPN